MSVAQLSEASIQRHLVASRTPPLSSHIIEVVQDFSTKQAAFERLNHLAHPPFRSIDIPQQLLDAAPAARTVKVASVAFIKKFTMLLAHVFLVFLAVFDFHPLPSRMGLCLCLALRPKNHHATGNPVMQRLLQNSMKPSPRRKPGSRKLRKNLDSCFCRTDVEGLLQEAHAKNSNIDKFANVKLF